jgi:hypothetical protein
MISAQFLLLYLLPGFAVAVALYVTDRRGGKGERFYVVFSAVLFWPIYLPGLLASRSSNSEPSQTIRRSKDEMDRAIDQVDVDLSKALASLEGWAGPALAGETQRIHELRHAWTALADRIREMDRLLVGPQMAHEVGLLSGSGAEALSSAARERLQHSVEVRRQNMERLRNVRQRAYEDLMGTLAWVRELISMIHVARFTGAPAARVQELVAQIASAVEALGEVSDEERTSFPPHVPQQSPSLL